VSHSEHLPTPGQPELGFIHRYVPASLADAPTLLLLHGTGGDEADLLPLGQALEPEAGLLSPRGQVLEHGIPRFFRRLAEGVFDLDDLRQRTDALAAFVTTAAVTYGFDPRRVVAVGYSNGANIAASLLLLHPGVLRGAVLFHAQVPLEPEVAPDLSGVSVLLTGGRDDPLVPREETERLATLLRRAGANVTVHWQPGGHTLAIQEVDAARQWLDTNGR
jgi:phospholipase/carboxylesterase/glyoxalase family protein